MEVTEAENSRNFNRRRHEALRRQLVAPEVGRLAVAAANNEELRNLEKRREDELISGLAEALEGKVNTHYPFRMLEGRLVADDGEPIEEILIRGFREDMKLASQDSFYGFLPQRSRAELDNFRKAQAMARGELPGNTLVELSPYTEELDNSAANRKKLIKAAQKPDWGRSMIRVSHWDGEQMHIMTVSTDNPAAAQPERIAGTSSVQMLKEAVARQLGYEYKAPDSTAMLAESVVLHTDDDSWKTLGNRLADQVDIILSERLGGQWHQGREKSGSIDLQKYVESQKEVIAGLREADIRLALQHHTYEAYEKAFDWEIYKAAALLEKRQKTGRADKIVDYEVAASGAGAEAASEGKTYDMCGYVVGAPSANGSSTGDKTGMESIKRLEEKLLGKWINCVECREEVIVPGHKLREGRLCCTECGYEIDVCTGAVIRQSKPKLPEPTKELSPFAKWNLEYDRKQQAMRQKRELEKRKRAA